MKRTFGYAAMTKDAAQRSIRTFYGAVNFTSVKMYHLKSFKKIVKNSVRYNIMTQGANT